MGNCTFCIKSLMEEKCDFHCHVFDFTLSLKCRMAFHFFFSFSLIIFFIQGRKALALNQFLKSQTVLRSTPMASISYLTRPAATWVTSCLTGWRSRGLCHLLPRRQLRKGLKSFFFYLNTRCSSVYSVFILILCLVYGTHCILLNT